MLDEFVNRLAMFRAALGVLLSAPHKPAWFNLPPTIFTDKVALLETLLANLETFCGAHGVDITGSARDKAREERELEEELFELGSPLTQFFLDQNDETNAAKCDRTLDQWRRLRGENLLLEARVVRDLAQGVVAGPQSALAATYGVNAAAVTALSGEIADYEAVISTPDQAIAGRKSLTEQFRPRFNEVEAKFVELDRLIVKFNGTEAGRALIAAYFAARITRDRGAGPGTGTTPVPTVPGTGNP